ncbi:hypothetical protein FraEuI1c_2776 [Pseudofrankia inefficax]|uniref:Uncharacterized protein n=1 Tax=Pseudofrankia inefficax (strain DSM 45817 / CECT 9037 / DDB 130130 / EuI1c) TaxID=298654 RepID=E3J7P9_PSEI1|nr:hypothetical protein FraEuI1c_2776 [Pseudofrankia inefficax]
MKAGSRLRASNSACEVVVVRAPARAEGLLCAGVEMVSDGVVPAGAPVSAGPRIELGKRYVDRSAALEVLCTKPGFGPLVFGGEELTLKSAKPLPASD